MSVNITFIPIKPRGQMLNKATVLRALSAALTDTVAEGNRWIAEYPQAPPGQKYKRTGTLKRSWSMKPTTRRGDRLEAEVGSNGGMAPYNEDVQGEKQEAFFRRRGWRDVNGLVKLVQRELPVRAQRAIDRAAMEGGGR